MIWIKETTDPPGVAVGSGDKTYYIQPTCIIEELIGPPPGVHLALGLL